MAEHGSYECASLNTERLDEFCFRVIEIAFKSVDLLAVKKYFRPTQNYTNRDLNSFRSLKTSLLGLINMFDETPHLANRPVGEPIAQLFPVKNCDLELISEPIKHLRLLCTKFEPTAHYEKPFDDWSTKDQHANLLAYNANQLGCFMFAQEYLDAYNDLVSSVSNLSIVLKHEFVHLTPMVDAKTLSCYL